ncbi:MAG: hypothetical protein A2Z38_05930 [Planctomycetes bacterium RBG_19FT_COMBO_48_8]|nr:MAG: hypothetical protein A2Z38_05930 [Planctomycetes bacterium RBG_19FT_COMBO_48_8]
MVFFAQIISLVNVLTNTFGRFFLAPIAVLPGWLSNTIISAITGLFLLVIFKYTSNQRAIGKIKDDIKADMLAIKLFKDSISVTLHAEARVFKGALLLLFHAIPPMLVMIFPVSLLLAQMSLWYQSRPMLPGEVAVMTVKLNGNVKGNWPIVNIEPTPVAEVTVGPVRVLSRREICWEIKALENGKHHITLDVNRHQIEKELAIGDGFMRVSSTRPAWNWANILMHPAEEPFAPDSIVQSVTIDYPKRLSKTSGADGWLIYFFITSMVFAFISKPFLKVRI